VGGPAGWPICVGANLVRSLSMSTPQMVLIGLAGFSALVSAVGSAAALANYVTKEGASLLGFGFANYFWGDMRTEHPRTFWASIGGMLAAFAFVGLASVLR
jgi:mannose/fructose/N-acetylgalactosamine-specific phosphotransferase system component IIC